MRTIAQYRSFSRAAEKLHIAQPALSRYIKKLENELGAILFDRSKTPIELTEAGYRYLSFAENVLRQEIELSRDLGEMGKENTIIRFGAPNIVMESFLPTIFQNVDKLKPEEAFLVQPIDGRVIDLLPAMVNNQLDIAVLSSPLTKPGIHLEKLADQAVIAILRRDHPALRGIQLEGNGCDILQQVDLSFLNGQTVFNPSESSLIAPLFRSYINEMNIQPELVANMESPYFGLTMAQHGHGIWINMPMAVHSLPFSEFHDLCAVQIPELYVPIYLVYREYAYEHSQAIRMISDWIRSVKL